MLLCSRLALCRLALLSLFALAACDSGGPTDAGRVAGRYVGVRGPGVPPQAVTYDATLIEAANGTVSGQGVLFNEKVTWPITVSGTRDASRVRLAVRRTEFPAAVPDSFVATVSSDAAILSGTLFRPGGINSSSPFTLTRTPAAP